MRHGFTEGNLAYTFLAIKDKIDGTYRVIAAIPATTYAPAMISPAQIRAARAIIGWKQADLAKAASISEISVKNIERGATDPRASTLTAIETAFGAAGVIFLDPGVIRDGGAGVRLR